MSYSLIVLSSVTSAKRVERLATEYSIRANTLHTPKSLTRHGCSLSVKVKTEDLKQVYQLAEKLGMEIYGVYDEKNENGKIKYEKVVFR